MKWYHLRTETVSSTYRRPIVSNIGTASYYLSNYLAKFLSPLSQSEYTVKNTKRFVQNFKRLRVPGVITNWYHLMYHHYSPTCP